MNRSTFSTQSENPVPTGRPRADRASDARNTVMRTQAARIAGLLLLALSVGLLWGCNDIEETDTGGVFLKVDFVSVPGQVGVNDVTEVTIPTIDITSVVPNQLAGTSELMDVLIDVYEVTFTRADTGTRVPPAFIYRRAGTVPVGGNLALNNFPVMGQEQLQAAPLSDLLFENGGVDRETGSSLIRIDVTFQVFGKTIAGDDVASEPRTETMEFIPSTLVTP